MGTEVEIIFKWVSYVFLNQGTWQWISVSISRFGEKSDMMPLLRNYNSELWLGTCLVLV